MNSYDRYNIILRWWLFFSIIILGTAALLFSGMIFKVNQADVTKISFMIFILFIIFTIRTGKETYRLSKQEELSGHDIATFYQNSETGWFVSDILLTMGMIGTVSGFIYMLSTSFADVNFDNIGTVQGVLANMGTGMSTALYTTAAGLICSLLLKLQLYNLTSRLDFVSDLRERQG
jgi:uncharacterized membrane protein YtjA (UPF0391 family)